MLIVENEEVSSNLGILIFLGAFRTKVKTRSGGADLSALHAGALGSGL